MSEFADTDPLARSEARCWLNADCTRGYHGVMDEDGCQYGGPETPEVVQGAHNRPLTAQQVENEPPHVGEDGRR